MATRRQPEQAVTATRQAWSEDAIGSLHGRPAVVAGANSGIGLATAQLPAGYGARVVLACRDKGKGPEAAGHTAQAAPGAVNDAGVMGGPRAASSSLLTGKERDRDRRPRLSEVILVRIQALAGQPPRRAARTALTAARGPCSRKPGADYTSEMTDSPRLRAGTAPQRRPGKRDRLVTAAGQLLHQKGAEATTLADIAEAADVPVGNVYYYFKTKDEIITTVVQAHVQQARAAVAAIDEHHRTPKSRLKALLGELASQSEIVSRYGCPYGSLCSELDKRTSGTDFALGELMLVPIEWAEQQFRALGRRDARDLAMSLLASYEGSALLANTLRDPGILTREARRLTQWIDTL